MTKPRRLIRPQLPPDTILASYKGCNGWAHATMNDISVWTAPESRVCDRNNREIVATDCVVIEIGAGLSMWLPKPYAEYLHGKLSHALKCI